ncbi:MAG: MarR family winged helix-turn-helix transcriptional regulator [Aristaeellaceae bacterium]
MRDRKRRNEALDINNRLTLSLWDVLHTMRAISEGKGSQKRILMMLLETGPVTQKKLTALLGIQPGSASEVIGKLETAGLLSRTPNPADRRTTDVCLTEAGLAAAREAMAVRAKRHETMFSCFTPEEKQRLLALLEQLNTFWEGHYRVEESHPCDEEDERRGQE